MPRSKATKLEPQSHVSDERGELYRDKHSWRKKSKDVDEFSKEKTNDSSVYNFQFFLPPKSLFEPLRFFEKPSLKHLCTCYYWTSLVNFAYYLRIKSWKLYLRWLNFNLLICVVQKYVSIRYSISTNTTRTTTFLCQIMLNAALPFCLSPRKMSVKESKKQREVFLDS